MLVAEGNQKPLAPEERHNLPLLRSFNKRHGMKYYQYFAPNGAKSRSLRRCEIPNAGLFYFFIFSVVFPSNSSSFASASAFVLRTIWSL